MKGVFKANKFVIDELELELKLRYSLATFNLAFTYQIIDYNLNK